MPQTHTVSLSSTNQRVYLVQKPDSNESKRAHVLEKKDDKAYVHYVGNDKRLDEWVHEDWISPELTPSTRKRKRPQHEDDASDEGSRANSRRRVGEDETDGVSDGDGQDELKQEVVEMSEEAYDLEQHKQLTSRRNFDEVFFSEYRIKTWYFSPYPLTESEDESNPHATLSAQNHNHSSSSRASSHTGGSASNAHQASTSITSTPVFRAPRTHPRTLDLFSSGLKRTGGAVGSYLWVCEWCFKYMVDGATWEHHTRVCDFTHPPGKKVFERGAHAIWEVDGAKEKVW
jgi:hypothetical protein